LVRRLNNSLDQIITLSLVDVWVLRTGIGVPPARPPQEAFSLATLAAGPSGETFYLEEFEPIYINETLEKLTYAFTAACDGLRILNSRWDKIVTTVALDSWLAEPLETIFAPSGEAPPIIKDKIGELSAEEFEQLDILHQLYVELKNLKFSDFFYWIKTIDNRWDKIVTRAVLDTWLAEAPETILGPAPARGLPTDKSKIDEINVEDLDSLRKLYEELRDLKFGDFCNWIRVIDNRWDKIVTRAVLDTWLAEPPETILRLPSGEVPTTEKVKAGKKGVKESDSLAQLYLELKNMKFSDFFYWMRGLNKRLDKMVTKATLDAWLAEPPETILGPPAAKASLMEESRASEKLSEEPNIPELLVNLYLEFKSLKSSEFVDWLKDLNKRLDRIVTAASLEEPPATVAKGKKGAKESDVIADNLVSKLSQRLKRIFSKDSVG
jgi:hypothetical protein